MKLSDYCDVDTLHDGLIEDIEKILGVGISQGHMADIISAIENRLEETLDRPEPNYNSCPYRKNGYCTN